MCGRLVSLIPNSGYQVNQATTKDFPSNLLTLVALFMALLSYTYQLPLGGNANSVLGNVVVINWPEEIDGIPKTDSCSGYIGWGCFPWHVTSKISHDESRASGTRRVGEIIVTVMHS